jgi:hypothetical protein
MIDVILYELAIQENLTTVTQALNMLVSVSRHDSP